MSPTTPGRGLSGNSYLGTWRETGPVGRRFLTGTALYAVRLGAVLLLLPLLASARGYTEGEIGVLISAASLPLLVLSLPIMWLGRRGWNRHLLAAAPLLAAVGLLLFASLPPDRLATSAAAAFLTGLGGAAFWTLGDPILVAATPAARRTHVFALKFACWISGFAVGGALGGALPTLFGRLGLEQGAALAGALLIVAALDLSTGATFWSLPVPGPLAASAPGRRTPPGQSRWPLLLALVLPEAFVAVGYGSVKPYLSLFLVEGRGFSTAATGGVLSLAAVAGGIGSLGLPLLIARVGSVPALVACRGLGATAIVLWFVGLGAPLLIALVCLCFATIDGTEGSFVAAALERVPPPNRGLFSGLYALFWSLGSAGASFAGGQIQGATGGFAVAFTVGAAGYLLFALWVGVVFPRLPRLGLESDDAASQPTPPGEGAEVELALGNSP